MDAAIYARISRDFAGSGLGISRQVEDCTRKIESLGWSLLDVYEDNDISASKDVLRPSYARLLADIASGAVRAVVVYDLDRLTRKPAELETFIDLAERYSVALANVSGDVDLTTSGGRMMARVKGAVARQEAERIGERTARQKRQRAEAGKPLGSRFRTFGYSRSWEVIDDEAHIVREVFARAAKGETQGSITADLVSRDIRTVTDGLWRPLNTSRLLRNPLYAGRATYKGQVVAKSQVPALIDEVLFASVQRGPAPARHGQARRYLLSGFAVCGACNGPMTGSSGRYRCDVAMGGCGKVGMRADWADEPISSRVLGYHQQTQLLISDEAKDWQTELDLIDARIAKLNNAYEAGDLALEDLVALLKIERQQRKAVVAEARENPSQTAARTLSGMHDWKSADLGEKRAILSRYLKHVVIQPSGKGRQPAKSIHRLTCHWTNGVVEPSPHPMSLHMHWR